MRGLFFNAQPTTDITNHPSGFDREYDSDDFNRYMGVFFSNGVFVRNDPDACKVTASGLQLDVTPGVVLLDGGQCHFEPGDGLTITQGDGLYSVMCRRNNAVDVRAFELVAVRGDGEYPAPVREGDLYDLCLAHVQVEDGVSTVTDTRSNEELCGMALIVAPKSQDTVTRFPWMHDTYDFNDLLADGVHERQGIAQNSPYGSGADQHFWVHVYRHNDHYLRQVAFDVRSSMTWTRSRIGGIWLPWRRVMEEGYPLPGWALLWSHETAGSGTWVAPDLNWGRPYKIGVFEVGGGQGGGALRTSNVGSPTYTTLTGGLSGESACFELTVTPGQSIPWVVGSKGIGYRANQSNVGGSMGGSGGSTAFNGITARGGSSLRRSGSGGGQVLSQAIGAQWPSKLSQVVPFGGIVAFPDSGDYGDTGGVPTMCFNPFTNRRVLGAGGSTPDSYTPTPAGVDPTTGLGGGFGAVMSSQPPGTILNAGDATAPGCGGGHCWLHIDSNSTNTPGNPKGGDGADGAIYLYVRGVGE